MKQIGFTRWWLRRFFKQRRTLKELYKVETRNPTCTIEDGVRIFSRKHLQLGRNCYIATGSVLHGGGGDWCNHGGGISIGDHLYMGPYCVILGAGEVRIGNRCQFGPGVMLISHSLDMARIRDETTLDQDTAPHIFGKITLEDGVMIGAGSVVLMGVTIGRGAYIAGGCTIKKDVPPYSFVIPRERYKTINRNSPLVIK